MRKSAKMVCMAILFLIGLILTSYPYLARFIFYLQSQEEISTFQEIADIDNASDPIPSNITTTEDPAAVPDRYTDLYLAMQNYNTALYTSGQTGLDGVDSYETPPVDLADYGIDFDAVGYISIPAMEVELPLYLGASSENMTKGAVVLGQTSLPIGGANTNCVIAAHRGYQGIPYFREIERLQVGDTVEVTTFWDTMCYQVIGWQIVPSDSVDQILIQSGKDMITLLTCHPYRIGTQRYLVYCERSERKTTASDEPEAVNSASDEEVYSPSIYPFEDVLTAPVDDSSQFEIEVEKTIQNTGLVIVLIAGISIFINTRKRKSGG